MNVVYYERTEGNAFEARWENGDGDKLRKRFLSVAEIEAWARRIGARRAIDVS